MEPICPGDKRVHSTPHKTKSLRKSKSGSRSTETGQDLELLKLGRQLDLLLQRYECARQRFIPVWEAHKRLCVKHPGSDEVEILRDLSEGMGEHPDDPLGEIGDVSDAILAIPATTTAGPAAKARLAAFAAEDYWDGSAESNDWEKIVLRKLVDADPGRSFIGGLAGVPLGLERRSRLVTSAASSLFWPRCNPQINGANQNLIAFGTRLRGYRLVFKYQ